MRVWNWLPAQNHFKTQGGKQTNSSSSLITSSSSPVIPDWSEKMLLTLSTCGQVRAPTLDRTFCCEAAEIFCNVTWLSIDMWGGEDFSFGGIYCFCYGAQERSCVWSRPGLQVLIIWRGERTPGCILPWNHCPFFSSCLTVYRLRQTLLQTDAQLKMTQQRWKQRGLIETEGDSAESSSACISLLLRCSLSAECWQSQINWETLLQPPLLFRVFNSSADRLSAVVAIPLFRTGYLFSL